MGNICGGGAPKEASEGTNNAEENKGGFLKTITNLCNKGSPAEETSKEDEAAAAASASNDAGVGASSAVQDIAPGEIKVEKEDEKLPDQPAEPKQVETKEQPSVKKQPTRLRSKPSQMIRSTESMANDIEKDKSSQTIDNGKDKIAQTIKSVSSVGLQKDSVLKTKTGHLKESYNLGRKLGNGQFGTTFLCTEKATEKEYACKSIAKRKLRTQGDVEDVRREIQIMHHLSGQPNVVAIKGAFEDSVAVHVVMELCAGGELFDRIIQKGHYTEKKAATLARTIVGVVETCHSMGVMHRDLKPENFLFVQEEEDSPLKAIDFGLSTFFKPGDIFHDVVGSPYYVAPEVLRKKYGPEADVWSAGVMIYILLCGVPPFWGETEPEIFEEVLHGKLDFSSNPWPHISDDAKDLIKKMLVRDVQKRISAHEVLCHPWAQIDGLAPDKPLDPVVLSRMKQFSAMNKLKKMALRVIAQRLSEEEIAGLREMFKMIDTDNSGQISYDELKSGLKKFGASLDESETHDLMQAADVDKSGTIGYEEFIAATLHLNKVVKEDHLFAAFSYFDKDGSGYITQDELQQACKEFGIDEGHLQDMIREVDTDNDGRIDYNEFVAMMQKGNAELGRKGQNDGGLSVGVAEALPVC